MEWILIGLSLLSSAAAFFTGYHWHRASKEAEGYILCTPKQVVEAVRMEYRLKRVGFVENSYAPVLIGDEHMSAERIADNLIQLVETKGDKTSG